LETLAGIVTVGGSVAPEQTLLPLVIALAVGSALRIPSLLRLYTQLQTDPRDAEASSGVT